MDVCRVVLWGLVFWMGLIACERTPRESSLTPTPTQSPVLAWIGNQPLYEKDFLARYRAAGSPMEPAAFLQALLDEEILWRESVERGLLTSRQVREQTQKMQILQLLKLGFEQEHNPRSIPAGLVLDVYNARLPEFVKPVLLRTVHLLAERPKHPSHQRKRRGVPLPPIPPAEQAILEAEFHRRTDILRKVLLSLRAAKARTKADFERVVRPFLQEHNRPHPSLIQVGQTLRSALELDPKMTSAAMLPLFRELLHRVPQEILCTACPEARKLLGGWKGEKGPQFYQPMSPSTRRYLLHFAQRFRTRPQTALRYEEIPPFPERETNGFFNVVRPFAKAAYTLKDGEISGLVETSFGNHLILRLGSSPPETKTYAEVEGLLRKEIYELQKKEMFQHWLNRLLANHHAKIFPKRLEKIERLSSKGSPPQSRKP
ncbi:peptidylprolyl isomerase [Myxococcota bacterium]|nr:peptidylprolyl isomerase [Myxococcota bacterium]